MFLKLTLLNGDPTLVHVRNICDIVPVIYPEYEYVAIRTDSNRAKAILVEEHIEEIEKLLRVNGQDVVAVRQESKRWRVRYHHYAPGMMDGPDMREIGTFPGETAFDAMDAAAVAEHPNGSPKDIRDRFRMRLVAEETP